MEWKTKIKTYLSSESFNNQALKWIGVTSIFCIIATIIPLFSSNYWFIRVFDFPHAQLTSLTFLCLVSSFYYVTKKPKIFAPLWGVLLAVFIYQSSIIFPYTSLREKQVLDATQPDEKTGLTLLSANVHMKNRKPDSILTQINREQPDFVVLLETDQWWLEQMKPIKKDYPYSVEEPLDNTYGLLVYSKLPLIEPEVKYLIEPDIPSVHGYLKMRSGQKVKFYVVHPTPPSPTENSKSAERDAELLLVAKMAERDTVPTIVIGDLNDVAWSHTTQLFQEISGLLDPRIGRGLYNTFNAKFPILRWPLDHIFHSNHFKLVKMKRLPFIHSDHFPIFTHLNYEFNAQFAQEKPQAKMKEEQKATKAIQNGKNSD